MATPLLNKASQRPSAGPGADSVIAEAIVEQAIGWLVCLQSGLASSAQIQACAQWRADHPDHERAWLRLQALGDTARAVPSPIAHATLTGSSTPPRRAALKSIVLLVGVGGLSYALRETSPGQRWLAGMSADYATEVGERRTVLLDDGTRLTLNTDSAVRVRFSAQRSVELLRGEIFIITASDPRRPFIVRTAEGAIRALGTRFLVRQFDAATRVDVFEGAVQVSLADGEPPQRVDAGHGLRFMAHALGNLTPLRTSANAWIEGVIIAKAMRLADFSAELSRYRPGVLRCDPAVAELRISGVFPLSDTDQVLSAVARTLSLKVESRTRWWTTLRAQ